MHGFLNIDKPAGMTSHDVVARVRRLTRQKRVGHAGTLDPAATGVLVVALGQATRLIEYVQEETHKRYTAVVRLGETTTTDDAEGDVLETRPVPPLSEQQVERLLLNFRGLIEQVPPMYSALHHQGQRLYELARAGQHIDLQPRPVKIFGLRLEELAPPLMQLDVECGKGTYIRSLARDIGAALGCGGHLAQLRRTMVGTFPIERAITLEQLEQIVGTPAFDEALFAPRVAVEDWPAAQLDHAQLTDVRHGRNLRLSLPGDRAVAYGPDGRLLALLAQTEDGDWHPAKVFSWE